MLIFNQFIKISEGPKIFVFEVFVSFWSISGRAVSVCLTHGQQNNYVASLSVLTPRRWWWESIWPTAGGSRGVFSHRWMQCCDLWRCLKKTGFQKGGERKRDMVLLSHTLQNSQKHWCWREKRKEKKKCIFHNYVPYKLFLLVIVVWQTCLSWKQIFLYHCAVFVRLSATEDF